jgi:hypothetical protein
LPLTSALRYDTLVFIAFKSLWYVGQGLDERGSSSTKQTPAKHRIAPAKSDGLPARLSNPLNIDSAMMNGRQLINP